MRQETEMADIQWESAASLMRVTNIETSGDVQEELIAQGSLFELVATFLEMRPEQQSGLLLRAAGSDWTQEFDTDTIRELAARPDFTSVYSDDDDDDDADLDEDPDEREVSA
jgi:hypothetical protein